ncbi:mitochondrial carrier [Testicularia cyperi]|uniref:Mitochondrial carrier n=1 Tax=Testicularia cyperi TaxID=1882483 RepID=A0A317XT97_9BASI|nr:mitochondrial carrier [Testicularia cyperi]
MTSEPPIQTPFGFTRSSQASTSASTLESFLESSFLPPAVPSQLSPLQLPQRQAERVAGSKFTSGGSRGAADLASSSSPGSALSSQNEAARAQAYEQVHASSSAHDDDSDDNHDSHAASQSAHPHHGTNSAFLITYFVAGGAAGATSRTVVSPLERLKIIMQVQPQRKSASGGAAGSSASGSGAAAAANKRAYSGVYGGLVKMWKEEGFAGFMRGNGINCLRIAPYSAVQFTTYEMCKTWLKEHSPTGELDVISKLTAGAIAGIASVVSTYPLDLVRSRISIASANMYNEAKSVAVDAAAAAKTPPPPATEAKPPAKISQEVLRAQIAERQKKVPGIWNMTKQVYTEEGGLRGLYRGCVPTSVGVAPYVALNFYFYEAARKFAMPLDGSEPSALVKLGCGALAGSISQTVTYPLDVLRRRMQVAGMKDSAEKLGYKDKNAIDCIRNIVRAEGVTGLYRGLLPNLLKVAPSIGTSFLTYEAVKSFLESHMDDLHLSHSATDTGKST